MKRDMAQDMAPASYKGPRPGAKTLKQRRDTVCMPKRLFEDSGIMLAGQIGDGIGRYRPGRHGLGPWEAFSELARLRPMRRMKDSMQAGEGDCSGGGGRGSKRRCPEIAAGLGMVVPGKRWHSCLQPHLLGNPRAVKRAGGSGALSAGQAWKIVKKRI